MTDTRKRYLEERIVFCANCDGNRKLRSATMGLVCERCESSSWMYLPQAIGARSQAAPHSEAHAMEAMSTAFLSAVQRLSSPGLTIITGA